MQRSNFEYEIRHNTDNQSDGKRTRLERWLIILAVFLVAIVIALIIAVAVVSQRKLPAKVTPRKENKTMEEYCLKKTCVNAASKIIKSLNTGVDPCDDFYEYACGNWIKSHAIPMERKIIGTLKDMQYELSKKLINLLESLPEEAIKEDKAMKETRTLYKSCINLTAIETMSVPRLKQTLESLGGWPSLTPSWNDSNFELFSFLIKLKKYDTSAIFGTSISNDLHNSTKQILYIYQAMVGLRSKSKSHPLFKAYSKLLYSLMIELGANSTTAREDVDAILEFETQLLNIQRPQFSQVSPSGFHRNQPKLEGIDEDEDSTLIYEKLQYNNSEGDQYRLITADILMQKVPGFNWSAFLHGIFDLNQESIQFSDSETGIGVSSVWQLNELVKIINTTDSRTLANYGMLIFVKKLIEYLPEKFRKLKFDYDKLSTGQIVEEPRSSYCVSIIKLIMDKAMSALFVENYFTTDAKEQVIDMANRIRSALKEVISEVEWLDEKTKMAAKEKSDAIIQLIGYPDGIRNKSILNGFYEMVHFKKDEFLDSILDALKMKIKKSLLRLKFPPDRKMWMASAATVNAYFNPSFNTITIPAGILQPPFFHLNYPTYLNYGAIGIVIGHEFTHGFDNQGKNYDKEGNLKIWWSNSSTENFEKQTRYLVQQYNNITIKQLNIQVNGKQTLGENIADNGGIKVAYRAYVKLKREKQAETEELLPGVFLNPDQLFFVNFAQVWCTRYRDEALRNAVNYNVHAPGYARVVGTLQNFEDFSKAYKCPRGSKMNPHGKYSVW